MVGHHDVGVELVTFFIKMVRGVGDDVVVFAEAAGAVAVVEEVFKREGETRWNSRWAFVSQGLGWFLSQVSRAR